MSPPSRAAWIEMQAQINRAYQQAQSPPSRAAWIEIIQFESGGVVRRVAAFTGGVD